MFNRKKSEVMKNVEIVKSVFSESTLFHGKARVSKYSNDSLVTFMLDNKVVYNVTDFATLKLFIEQKGGDVKDIFIQDASVGQSALVVDVMFNR